MAGDSTTQNISSQDGCIISLKVMSRDLGEWKGGLDWVKIRCLVIIIHFKTPVLSGKIRYSRKLKRYLVEVDMLRSHIMSRAEMYRVKYNFFIIYIKVWFFFFMLSKIIIYINKINCSICKIILVPVNFFCDWLLFLLIWCPFFLLFQTLMIFRKQI